MGRGNSESTSLAPGFRFHPTDEELVSYYLKRKVCAKPFRFDAISEIDIYRVEPWDLPGLSKLKSRDLEWYFFSVLDKKYGNGSRTNRATGEGYWKTTGKDREVHHKSRVVGMKKTLVYHRGRAPRGERTNWVMHEYRLVDEELVKAGVAQDAFVLCRIFQKSGSGPKNGEQYGAPFIEEEWEDDNIGTMVPGGEFVVADEVVVGDDAFVEQDDLDQNLDVQFPSEVAQPPLSFYFEAGNNNVEDPRNFAENDLNPYTGTSENQLGVDVLDDSMFFNLPLLPEMDLTTVKNEYMVEQSNPSSSNQLPAESSSNVIGEPILGIDSSVPFDDGFFLEANDLSEPVEVHPSDFDTLGDCLAFFDAGDDIEQYLTFDVETDVSLSDPAHSKKEGTDEREQFPSGQQFNDAYGDNGASSSKEVAAYSTSMPDIQHPFSKKMCSMLGDINAPPAFACEIPTKDMTARLNAAASGSFHVTAGMIRISNTELNANAMQWSMDKNGNVNVLLSFDLPDGVMNPVRLDSFLGVLPGKMASTVSRGWFCFLFFWVLFLAVSIRIGTCIYAK